MTLKQVFVVNSDLGMGKGKIAAQCCHGEVLYMEYILEARASSAFIDIEHSLSKRLNNYVQWREKKIKPIGLMKKVVLKASLSELLSVMRSLMVSKIRYYEVHDAGLTQVEEGSLTCICVEPLEESRADELFGHLKLL